MPKVFTSKTQKTGELGEGIAVKFLMKQGFSIIERNYTRKWGEIDIVAEKDKKLYFIEVKAVTHETGSIRPEENMHQKKLERLYRTIQTYLAEHNVLDKPFQIDLLCVYLDIVHRKARVDTIENII